MPYTMTAPQSVQHSSNRLRTAPEIGRCACRIEGGPAHRRVVDRASTRVAAPFGPIWNQLLVVCVLPSV